MNYLQQILAYKKWLIGVCSATFAVVFLFRYFTTHQVSESKIRFYITAPDFITHTAFLKDEVWSGTISDPNIQRLKSFATSHELMKFIMDTLNLYAFSYAESFQNGWSDNRYQLFKKNYSFEVNSENEMIVTFKDREMNTAKAAAKAIMHKLNWMYNEYYFTIIRILERRSRKQLKYFNARKEILSDSLEKIMVIFSKFNLPPGLYDKLNRENCYECPFLVNGLPQANLVFLKNRLLSDLSLADSHTNDLEEKLFNIEVSKEILKEKSPIVLEETYTAAGIKSFVIYFVDAMKATTYALCVMLCIILLLLPEIAALKNANGSEHIKSPKDILKKETEME